MRIDRSNVDKFAALFKAGKPKQRRKPKREAAPVNVDHSYDDTIPPGTQLYKTRRERELDAIQLENRRWKRYLALRKSRLDRLASEVPAARRFLKTLAKVEAEGTARATAYRDIDIDIAGLAKTLGLARIEGDYDRFTLYEEAVGLCKKLAKGTEFAEPDPDTYFATGIVTALDELKAELRLR